MKARLPKLEVKKFNSRIQEWQEFWDAFESSIDKNDGLSTVDKFSYLRSLVQEPARSTIAGFALTGANYEEAVRVLRNVMEREQQYNKHASMICFLCHRFIATKIPLI